MWSLVALPQGSQGLGMLEGKDSDLTPAWYLASAYRFYNNCEAYVSFGEGVWAAKVLCLIPIKAGGRGVAPVFFLVYIILAVNTFVATRELHGCPCGARLAFHEDS